VHCISLCTNPKKLQCSQRDVQANILFMKYFVLLIGVALMKTLTFNIICSLIFRVERGARREKFVACFQEMMVGMSSVPVNLPFTRYNRGLKASATVQNMVKDLIREKRVEVEQKGASPHQDLVTCLLSTRMDNEEVLTEDEIVHNVMLVMVAGHDTSSVLMTFIMRLLANEPSVYAAVLQGIHKTLSLFLSMQ
jgi:cytochrome P450